MPFALVIIGLIMIVTGAKGTHAALGQQLTKDFTGDRNFLYWLAAIGSLGALGSIPQFKQFSRWFMALVIIAMIIRNGGFFDRLIEAIQSGPVAPVRAGGAEGSGIAPKLAQRITGADPDGDYDYILGNSTFGLGVKPGSPADNFRKVIGVASKFFNPFGG